MIATVRTDRGALHVAKLVDGAWECACWRSFAAERPDLVVYRGRDATRAFRLELVCLDCSALLERGREGFARASGWRISPNSRPESPAPGRVLGMTSNYSPPFPSGEFAERVQQNVRAELAARQISFRDLADRLAIPRQRISERNQPGGEWRLGEIEAIAHLLEIAPEELTKPRR